MNLFRTLTPEPPAPKKASRAVYTIAGVAVLSAIDSLIKTLGTLKSTWDAKVQASAREIYVEEALATGQVPETFNVTEAGCNAQIQFRQRSSASALPPETCRTFDAQGIPYGFVVKTKGGTFIKPEILADDSITQILSDFIMGHPVLSTKDLFGLREEVCIPVSTKDTVKAICATIKDKHMMTALLNEAQTTATTVEPVVSIAGALQTLKAVGHDLMVA